MVGQFTVTAALMTMTLLIWSQVDYVQDLLRRDSSLGFEPEQVTVIRNQGLTLEQTRVLKSELLQDSRIALVSLAETLPGNLSRTWYEVTGGGRGQGAGEDLRSGRRLLRDAGPAHEPGPRPHR